MTRTKTISGLLLGLLLLSGACQSGGGEGSLLPHPKESPNLLAESDRGKLYYELDNYTTRYMEARSEGRRGAWYSLHESLLQPLVDSNLPELLRTVDNEDEKAFRRIAARGLGFASDSGKAVAALIDQLDDSDNNLVVSALASLYVQADPATDLRALADGLLHPDSDARTNTALALSAVLRARRRAGTALSTEDRQMLAGRLVGIVSNLNEDDFARGEAATALGEVGEPTAADLLVNLLTDDASVVRTKAAIGLGLLGQEQAVPPLIDALSRTTAPREQEVIGASIARIAKLQGWPVNAAALGGNPRNWRNWYLSVSR